MSCTWKIENCGAEDIMKDLFTNYINISLNKRSYQTVVLSLCFTIKKSYCNVMSNYCS